MNKYKSLICRKLQNHLDFWIIKIVIRIKNVYKKNAKTSYYLLIYYYIK